MIIEEIDSPRLGKRQRKLWGELRPGDEIQCPHDGLVELVIGQRAGVRGRHHVEVGGDDIAGRVHDHTHVRPASDLAPGGTPGAWR